MVAVYSVSLASLSDGVKEAVKPSGVKATVPRAGLLLSRSVYFVLL